MSNLASKIRPPLVIGVDVGGTKVAAGLVDFQGSIFGRVRFPTDKSSPKATLDCIAQAVEAVIDHNRASREVIQGVGLGVPGLVDPERGIGIAAVNIGWDNVPVKTEMENRLGLPCFVENDVKVAALGEARYGAGRGRHNLIYLSIGTGIAAGILIEGKIYHGPHGMAGEIGHAVVDPQGPRCKCGARGCLEAIASGPAIAVRAQEKLLAEQGTGGTGLPGGTVLPPLSHPLLSREGNLSAETVFKAAYEGDELAIETLAEVSEYLAFAIQFLALAYDPETIILSGGVAQGGDLLLDLIRSPLKRQANDSWVLGKVYHPEFVQLSALGKDIAVLGAAALVPIYS
jgi:glucokinase